MLELAEEHLARAGDRLDDAFAFLDELGYAAFELAPGEELVRPKPATTAISVHPTRGSHGMTRPFEGIRIIDITHVLAGPFAAYQLAVLGADVIKVEHPDEPDQSRESGTDRALNRRNLGTSFLTQGSNKRSITLDLKTEAGRDILKKLVARADVLVENYRPGAFEALGLGYEALSEINPRLI